MWNHYASFSLMITLALPLYIGVVLMLYILENSYADQYLIKKKLEYSSISDELTGAFNRHKLDELVDKSTGRFTFSKNTVLLMLDIDYFKKVNDTYGHQAGDEVLKIVSKTIEECSNDEFVTVRWGGEEFVLYMPRTDEITAYEHLEYLRKRIANTEIEFDDKKIKVTVTVGMCTGTNLTDYELVIRTADDRLYYGKRNGKNCVIK